MRLQKYIALCGKASRRGAEELIAKGRVLVNGTVIKEMGVLVDENQDVVIVDGEVITPEENKYYIMLNKPEGYVTTANDQFNRPTVVDLVKDVKARLFPVGRLDYDTEGLLLLTNDGDFTFSVTHPKMNIAKVYVVRVIGVLTKQEIKALEAGIEIDGIMTAPAKAEIIKSYPKSCDLKITIYEGRNRQVRKMIEAIGHNVYSLKRIAIGKLSLGDLETGKWRHLTKREVRDVSSK